MPRRGLIKLGISGDLPEEVTLELNHQRENAMKTWE